MLPASAELTPIQLIICRLGMSGEAFEQELQAWLAARDPAGAVSALLEAAAETDGAYLTTGVQIAAGIEDDTEAAWLSAMSLPAIRPYAVAELNRRAGRDPQHDPLPGLEPAECDAVVIASRAIVAGSATAGADGVAAAVRQAAAPGSETVTLRADVALPPRHRRAGTDDSREAASGQEGRESRTGSLDEGGLDPELTQARLTGPADALRRTDGRARVRSRCRPGGRPRGRAGGGAQFRRRRPLPWRCALSPCTGSALQVGRRPHARPGPGSARAA